MTSALPEHHKIILDSVLRQTESDPRLTALLAGGSLLHGGFDEHSDLDLVIVVKEHDHTAMMHDRVGFARSCGDLLAAFTGEHVGEPRLLICLYGPGPVHVDLKFVTARDLDHLIERPRILWSDSLHMNQIIADADVSWPNQGPDWFEERFWIWAHYAATKIARGELFEALGMLAFIREQVLGPLIHQLEGRPQRGVRRLEQKSPELSRMLARTVAGTDKGDISGSLGEAISLYEFLSEPKSANQLLRVRVKDFVARLKAA